MEITLEQLLGARDARYARQLSLTEAWPDRTLVCVTVVLPGPVKRDARSLKVAEAAVKAVQEVLVPAYKELRDLETTGRSWMSRRLAARSRTSIRTAGSWTWTYWSEWGRPWFP